MSEYWYADVSKLGSKPGRKGTDPYPTASSRCLVRLFLYGRSPNVHLDMGPTLTLIDNDKDKNNENSDDMIIIMTNKN